MSAEKQVVRFAVGSDAGAMSTVWRCWAQRGDIYLAPRIAVRFWKFSFHRGGFRWAFASEEDAAAAGMRSGPVMDEWVPRPFADGWVRLFTVVVPMTEVRPPTPWGPNDVSWVAAGPSDSVVNFALVLGPPGTSPDEILQVTGFETHTMHRFVLGSGRPAWLIAYLELTMETAKAAEIERWRSRMVPGKNTEMVDSFWMFGVDGGDNSRFWVELART